MYLEVVERNNDMYGCKVIMNHNDVQTRLLGDLSTITEFIVARAKDSCWEDGDVNINNSSNNQDLISNLIQHGVQLTILTE